LHRSEKDAEEKALAIRCVDKSRWTPNATGLA